MRESCVEVVPGEVSNDRTPEYDLFCGLVLKDLFDNHIDELVDCGGPVVDGLGEPVERATINVQYISA